MVTGCGITCIKYIIFFVNFLFFVLGVTAVSLGIYILVDKDNVDNLTMIVSEGQLEGLNSQGLLQKGAVVIIVVGLCLLVLGFLGCCGAWKESRCLLGMYCGIIIVIVVLQIVAAGLAIAFRERISDYLQDSLKVALTRFYEGTPNSSNPISKAFDAAQVYFECCGVMGADDFTDTKWYDSSSESNWTVPLTCCRLADRQGFLRGDGLKLEDPKCPLKDPSVDNPNTAVPCYYKIRDWIFNRAGIVIGIAVGIIVVEIVAVMMACCLYTAIEH